ncbi:MAG: hypothetical protein LH614_22110 [Pyrinomonadaceae bacterium]|nr:hypothetical protein [Pyrinomonadaceae bacterium]
MKKAILYSLVALVLITILLLRLDVVYVNISPHNYYRLNKNESILFEDAVSKFWGKVEKEKFDEIKSELSEDETNDYRNNLILNDLKENRSQFGKIISWEFFRSASPQITSESVRNPDEKHYHIEYLTKAENGEFCTSFIWKLKPDNEVKLFFVGNDSPVEWRIEERNKQRLVIEKHPNEIIIPYADRYIEIRY